MKFRRKKYITHKKYQFRLLGVLLGIVLAATLITTFVTHYFLLSSIVDFTAKYGHPPTGKELIYGSFKPLVITDFMWGRDFHLTQNSRSFISIKNVYEESGRR